MSAALVARRSELLAGRLERLVPIELPELESTAALLIRRDRKYVVPVGVAETFVRLLADTPRALEIDGRRRFHYESVYFDTPECTSYLDAARRRSRRFKVRTRSYLDSGNCLLEIKTRDPRGRTVKQRTAHPIESRDRLNPAGRTFVDTCPLVEEHGLALAPALVTRYTRATLVLGEPGVRITIDTDVEAETPDGRTVILPGMAIVETKSGGAPSPADRLIWSLGHRPIRVSKFCTSLAVLRPELPSNKWTPALRLPWSVADPGGQLDCRIARAASA